MLRHSSLRKPLTMLTAACSLLAMTVSSRAADVPIINGNMDTWASGALIDGRDVFPVNGAVPAQDGWMNWANHANGGFLRTWNPSTTNRWTSASNEFFDTSWGGGDASGDANGYVLTVRTHSINGAGGTTSELLDSYGNRTFPVATTAATSIPAGFSYTWGTELPTRNFEAAANRLTQTFDPTAKYTLSVKVGRLHADGLNSGATILPGIDLTHGTGDDVAGVSTRFANDAPALFDGYMVDLMAGGVVGSGGNNGGWAYGTTADPMAGDYIGTIGSASGGAGSIAADSWITSTVAYVPNPATQTAMNGLTGKNLVIRLGALENANKAITSAAAFDDVVLTKIVAGDANENDVVNFTDFNILANNYNGPTTGKTWATADFSGNGDVEFTDFNLLINNYGFDGTVAAALPSFASGASGDPVVSNAVAPGVAQLLVGLDGSLTIEGGDVNLNGFSITSASGKLIPDGDNNASPFMFYLSNTANSVDAGGFAPVNVNGLLLLGASMNPANISTQDFVFQYGTSSGTFTGAVVVQAVPEPGTLALVGLGAFGLVARAIRRRRLQKIAA